MATLHINSLILRCDGCEALLLDGQPFSSAMDARGAAYGEGWRFPAQLGKRTGTPINQCSDVCPRCLPDWKPQVYAARAGYRRQDSSSS